MKKVMVLLSSYNGEKYISEQLDSLLSQTWNNLKILIRDDGSCDKTVDILEKYRKKYPNKIDFVCEKNIGVIKSFFRLIEMSEESDYYFFCDQDDVWKKEKVEKAIEKIQILEAKNLNKNIGYCSNLKLVDSKLNLIGISFKRILKPSLSNCFFENIITGCTYSCNKNLFLKIRKEIKKIDISKVIMHDYFFYFINTLYGELIYDKDSYILYRQHENNVVGNKKGFFNKNIERLKKISSYKNKRYFMFKMLTDIYRNDIEKLFEIKIIDKYSNIFYRTKYFFSNKIKRQNFIDTLLIKIMYLLKLY